MTEARTLLPFLRVSSMGQKDNASREVQKAVIAAWANGQSDPPVELLPAVSVVESATCAADQREEFLAALNQLEDADGMIFYSIDRFFRNTEEGLRIARTRFLEQGKYFVSVSEGIDISTDEGWFMFTILLAVAEKEGQTIKKRFANGRAAKKSRGGYIGGETPYGWRSNRETKELEENPDEQEVVGKIKFYSARNLSAYEIARRLNEHKIPTRKGKEWTYKQIQSILQNNRVAQPV